MTHCENCGEELKRGAAGSWAHAVSPPGFDARRCVMGMSDGVPYGFSGDGAQAVPCFDPVCTQTEAETVADPWWKSSVCG